MHRRLTNFLMLKYLNDNGQNIIDNTSENKRQAAFLQKQNQQSTKKNLHYFPQSPTLKMDRMKINPRPSAHLSYRVATQTKQKLHNLTYSQKIVYISSLVKELQKLVKVNGYFYITEPMLQYDLEQPIINQLIFNYGHQTVKPIHPIHRNTKIDEQLQFVTELKKTLQEIFPTIDLGLKTHLLKMEKCLSARKIKSYSINKNNDYYETRTQRGEEKEIDVSEFHNSQLSSNHLSWQMKSRPKQRFSIAEGPKQQIHSFGNTITKNSSCIFEQNNCESQSDMRVSKCSTHNNEEEKKLAKTTQNIYPQRTPNRKATNNIEDEVNNLFVSSLSFNDNQRSNKKSSTKIEQQLNNLFISSLSFNDTGRRKSKEITTAQEQLQSLF